MTKPAFSVDEPRFKGGLSVTSLLGVGKVVRTDSDVIDALYKRNAISDEQWKAADQFQRDYERGKIDGGPKACDWERSDPSGDTPQEGEIRAKQRYRKAISLLGVVGSSVCHNVCCRNMHPNDWAHSRGERKEYGMGRLREALDVLDEFYGV